jgi:hypothetical protein
MGLLIARKSPYTEVVSIPSEQTMSPDPSHFHPDETSEAPVSPQPATLRNALIGASISGFIVFVYLSLSVDMIGWDGVGQEGLLAAIALLLLGSVCSALWGRRALQFLTRMLESVNLPF